MQDLENLQSKRTVSKQAKEHKYFGIKSDEKRQIEQSKSLPPLARAKRCIGSEKNHDERLNGWLRTRQNFDKSYKIPHETGIHLGQRNEIANARGVKDRVVQKHSQNNPKGTKSSRIDEGRSAIELVDSATLQSCEHKTLGMTVIEEGICAGKSLVEQLPCKDVHIKPYRKSGSSSLSKVPETKADRNDAPVSKGSTRNPSVVIGLDYPKSNYTLQNRKIGSQNVNRTITKGQSPKERRKSEPVVSLCNSNQRFSERLYQRTFSKDILSVKTNLNSTFETHKTASTSNMIKSFEGASSARGDVKFLEEDYSSMWHNEEGEAPPPRQLMQRRWSIERINSYDFGLCTAAEDGNKSIAAETLYKKELAPSPSDDCSDAHIKNNRKLGSIHGTVRGRKDAIQVDDQLYLTSVSSDTRVSGTRTIHRIEKEPDESNEPQGILTSSERKQQAVENERMVKLTKKEKKKPCRGLNQIRDSSWGKNRTTTKEILQKCYEESDDGRYSDDEDRKQVRIIMENVKLRGILKKTRRAEVKNVTFNRKVKMKILYYL